MTRRLLLGLTLLAACGRDQAATSLGHVTVDSVDGVPRTITDRPVGWVDTSGWKLVEVARIVGGTESPGDLIQPRSVAVDGAGRIFVSDAEPAVIKVYAPDGTFLHTIGREGAGPGEFNVGFIALHGAHLYLHDPRLSRTSLFDTAGTYIRSWPSSCCYWAPLALDSAGDVGVPGPPPPGAQQGDHNPYQRTVRWFRPDSTVADSTLVPSAGESEKFWTVKQGKRGTMETSIPFSPSLEFGFLPDRRLIVGRSTGYELAVTRRNGSDTVALFGRAWTPATVPEAMRQAEIDRMVASNKSWIDEITLKNTFRLADVPATAPAFDWMGVDGQGDLWIRTPVPADSTRSLFDVFDPRFRWLGQVSGSRMLRRWGTVLIGDRMIGYGEDETGDPLVVVYRIDRGH